MKQLFTWASTATLARTAEKATRCFPISELTSRANTTSRRSLSAASVAGNMDTSTASRNIFSWYITEILPTSEYFAWKATSVYEVQRRGQFMRLNIPCQTGISGFLCMPRKRSYKQLLTVQYVRKSDGKEKVTHLYMPQIGKWNFLPHVCDCKEQLSYPAIASKYLKLPIAMVINSL